MKYLKITITGVAIWLLGLISPDLNLIMSSLIVAGLMLLIRLRLHLRAHQARSTLAMSKDYNHNIHSRPTRPLLSGTR